jgi:hypothetical protein
VYNKKIKNGQDIFNLDWRKRKFTLFSGATDLCESDEKMEAMAGHCVWMEDFIPVKSPQKGLIKTLLWHLHSEGVCCAVSGLFPAYLAGRFKELMYAGLYVPICETHESETVKPYRQICQRVWRLWILTKGIQSIFSSCP